MSELDDRDDPVARRLARTLHEVAATTPVPDRRDAIASLLSPAGAGHRRGHRRTITALAVAAVVLVVVALAAVAIRRGDDGAVDLRPVEDPDLGTGWYLPGDGWTVTAATTEDHDNGEGFRPVTVLTASETGDDPAALVVTEIAAEGFPGGPDTSGTAEPVDVGGRPGSVVPPSEDELPTMFEPDLTVEHVVHAGDRRLVATSRHVDQEAVIDVLDAWADRIDAGEPVRGDDLPLPEGMEAAAPQTKTWRSETVVSVTATNDATGESVTYTLAPAGTHTAFEDVLDSDRTAFDGDAFTVSSDGWGPDEVRTTTRTGGPVDLVGGVRWLGSPEPDPEAAASLVASLHEVDAAAWRAALDPITPAVDPALLTAPTLFAPPLTG